MKKCDLLTVFLTFALAGSLCGSAYSQKAKVIRVPSDKTSESVEPDKVLYDRAMTDIKKGRYTEGRLTLQALINTYPDSEYLAKAKLGTADSYYKEGGTSNMTQAIEEYKNFIVFFPFLDEAAYAQMQVGMAYYRMMEKSDRDKTQAEAAETELQTFLLKYPQSPLAPNAEQKLREVQEVLADGEFKVSRFYYLKQDYRASAARLVGLTDRYPLYSQADDALWMLAGVYMRAKQASRNEDDRNHWSDLAGKCYARIVAEYPLSSLAPEAKSRLQEMGMAVPAPNPDAVGRMQKELAYEKEHHSNALLRMPLAIFKSSPDLVTAAHSGPPNLNPPSDLVSATEVLKQGAQGPSFTVAAASGGGSEGTTTEGGDTNIEEVTPSITPAAPITGVGVQIIKAPNDPNAPPVNSAPAPNTSAQPPANPPTASGAGGDSAAGSASVVAPPGKDLDAATSTRSATPDPATGKTATGTKGQADPQQKASKNNPKTESTSKKKKGLKKIIPW